MTALAPIILAFLLNSLGLYIFSKSKSLECLPYIPYIIFLVAVGYLLWHVNLKPSKFRRLYSWADFILEFSIAMLIMELIMNNFWLPLEMAFIFVIPKLADALGKLCCMMGFSPDIFNFLKWKTSLYISSYILSIFFLLCILHTTRIVDFRLFRYGPKAFITDTVNRWRNFSECMFDTPPVAKRKRSLPCVTQLEYQRGNRSDDCDPNWDDDSSDALQDRYSALSASSNSSSRRERF